MPDRPDGMSNIIPTWLKIRYVVGYKSDDPKTVWLEQWQVKDFGSAYTCYAQA